MLISPPFLPARTTGQLDADWVDMAMRPPVSRAPLSSAYEGSFPLSAALMWHNGLHVQARCNPDGITWPAVRAIAGGTIVYVSPPTKANTELADPQNHNPFGKDAAWTDNGLMIVSHEAEIGAANDEAALPTAFRFYSAYMHLGRIATNPATKKPWAAADVVERKDELGTPGQIYGEAGQIHLEICCDAVNAGVVLGRSVAWQENRPVAAPTSDGRTDTVFGSLWFYLPIGTPTRTTEPKQHRRLLSGGASATSDHFIPDTLREARWVALHYEQGNANLKSFDTDGNPVGNPLLAPLAEYGLYKDANARHESYLKHNPAAPGQISSSSPSGWFELLRFGRNLGFGGGTDPLPADAAHWREIPTATGTIWADLNAQGTHKFSDADFLPVAGWNCYDDDAKTDNQLCESPNLKRLLRHPEQRKRMAAMPERTMEADIKDRLSIAKRLNDPKLHTILRRAVCRFPTEWDRSTIEKRHEWTRNPAEKLLLDDPVHWKNFCLHLRAISFDDLPVEYKAATWRLHPAEFIATFRQCGWLSKKELKEVYPDKFYNNVTTPNPSTQREKFRTHINRTTRKYFINTGTRQTHFFGQGAVESSFLSQMVESSVIPSISPSHPSLSPEVTGFYQSTTDKYFDQYNYRLGNVSHGDGIKFRGRGMKQLTALENYSKYWVYRAWIEKSSFDNPWWIANASKTPQYRDWTKRFPVVTNPQQLSLDGWSCIDAGTWYWEAGAAKTRFMSINMIITENGVSSSDVLAVTLAINGGTNSLENRKIHTQRISEVLMDL
ncbi:glycoside hydrolase family 19 protein [Variovorax sp. RHLX14]|uniref:glycoside hydrolase family 19 protein n=1 Tax=Variovorax sp. RHLX14 TaxID=1259731 RepID=UPI003F4810C5